MKKLTTIFLTGLATLFFTACGGGSGDNTPAITVNVIGTWNYQTFTQNSMCDGLLAQGIKVIDSADGDTSKIGNSLTQGTTFEMDAYQNCYIAPIYRTTSFGYGSPSTITSDEYLNLLYGAVAGDNTVESIRVDSFNNNKIQKEYKFTNGVIITEVMTR